MEDAIQSSVYVSSPDFASWLSKRGFHWRKLWKRRWIALHGVELVYMDKEPTLENASSISVSKAKIIAESEVQDSDPEGNPLGFTVLINDGHSPVWHLRAETAKERKAWMIRIGYILAIVRWLAGFEKVKVLGVGGTGIVYELLHKTNGLRFALKEIEIRNQRQRELAISEAEMLKDIMENVSHPSIMHIEKVFQVGSKFYLVFPLCTGGELYEHIIKRGYFTERDAAIIMRDLVSGLQALHQHDILHLDIKPENILFDGVGDDARIKITDFGLSRIFKLDNKLSDIVADSPAVSEEYSYERHREKVAAFAKSGELNYSHIKGTVGYMSPELILFDYKSRSADIFASGVILYILLTGRPPFARKTDRQTIENTICGSYDTSHAGWKQMSDMAKDLIMRMLDPNPLTRIATEDVLCHPWITCTAPAALETNTIQLPADKFANGNLNGTLKLLSKHVSRLRSTKIATNLTRLATLMRNGQNNSSNSALTLADKFLVVKDAEKLRSSIPEKGSLSSNVTDAERASSVDPSAFTSSLQQTAALLAAGENGEEEMMMFQNSELRDAIAIVIAKLTHNYQGDSQDGNNSVSSDGGDISCSPPNQSLAPTPSLNTNSFAVAGLSIDQFILLLQHLHYAPSSTGQMKPMNRANVGALLFSRFVDRDGDGYITLDDMVNAQAMILQRSESFLRLLFRIYLESQWYPGRQLNFMNLLKKNSATPTGKPTSNTVCRDENELNNIVDVVEPPRYITAKHLSAVLDKLGYHANHASSLFDSLCEIARVEKEKINIQRQQLQMDEKSAKLSTPGRQSSDQPGLAALELLEEASTDPVPVVAMQMPSTPGNNRLRTQSSQDEDSDREDEERTISTDHQKYNAMHAGQRTLDVQDFILVARVDDVLVQAIVRSPRRHTSSMLQRAIRSSLTSNNQFPPSYYIEQELLQAFRDADKGVVAQGVSSISSYASSLGKLTLSAAFDLASMLSNVTGAGSSGPDDMDISI